jgi:hypothetical protein
MTKDEIHPSRQDRRTLALCEVKVQWRGNLETCNLFIGQTTPNPARGNAKQITNINEILASCPII